MKHNWEYKPFKQLANILYGCPFESDYFNSESKGMPLIRIRDVKPGFTSSFFDGDYSDEYIIKKGEYLIGMDGEFNIAPWKSENALLNQRVCRVKSSNEEILSTDFIFYFLGQELKRIEEKTPFVTVKHLSAKVLNSISTPVPHKKIQEQIVAELDKINEVIADCRELLRNLDALAQSLFYDFFGDPISNPKGWQTQVLSEIAPQHPYKGKFSVDDDLWLLNLDMIEKNTGRIINRHKVKYEDIGNSVYKIGPNQVLYSKLRPNLNKVVIADDFGYCTSELLPLNPQKGLLNCQYLAYLLRTKECVTLFSGKVAGAKMPRTDLKTFRTFQIPVPPLALQEKFAARIEQIEAQKKHVEASIADLETLLASRMDYWFND